MQTLNAHDLDQFTGTTEWYKHLSGYVYTQGVQYVAEKGGAYWLLDKILFTIRHLSKPKPNVTRMESENYSTSINEFSVWDLLVFDNHSAILKADDGNGFVLYTEKISFTDFPSKQIKFYFAGNCLMLPSEY